MGTMSCTCKSWQNLSSHQVPSLMNCSHGYCNLEVFNLHIYYLCMYVKYVCLYITITTNVHRHYRLQTINCKLGIIIASTSSFQLLVSSILQSSSYISSGSTYFYILHLDICCYCYYNYNYNYNYNYVLLLLLLRSTTTTTTTTTTNYILVLVYTSIRL